MTSKHPQRIVEGSAELRAAFDEASAWAASAARLASAGLPDLQHAAERDLAQSPVLVDERGLTLAAYQAFVAPARDALQRWRALRSVFLARLEPRRTDIDAVNALPHIIADLQTKRAAQVAQLRERWAERPRNALISRQWDTAQAVYEQESLRHGQRLATMRAYSPFYWVALLLIGVAEWLINYDTFLIFTGVVAIAAGATIVLGVLLAFAAHGHGETLKQWSYRFGRFQTRQSRVGAWRMLALSSFAVIVVLAAAGGSRYAAVLRSLSQTQQPNMIGGGYQLDINPARDVLLSLLANIAAWIVGVFISYFCHDVDPDFMAATHQHRRTSRAYFRARRRLEEETQVIQESTNREVAALENSAFSRRAATEGERNMLAQIGQHDLAIVENSLTLLRGNLSRYRAELVRQLQSSATPAQLLLRKPDGASSVLALEAYADMPLTIDAGLLEQQG